MSGLGDGLGWSRQVSGRGGGLGLSRAGVMLCTARAALSECQGSAAILC